MGKREYTPAQLDRLQQLREEQARDPLRWFKHDVDASRDPKLRRLIRTLGWDMYGRWWRLCELMAEVEGHGIDVSDDCGWELLSEDLDLPVDACREFVAWLVGVGLLSRDSLEGFGTIRSERMQRDCLNFVEKSAIRRLNAEITNEKRWGVGPDVGTDIGTVVGTDIGTVSL